MNNNNIVKIGTALKWRNTYSDNKRYYQENIVTMCGSVFRCKILQTIGKSPVKVIDDMGRIEYDNDDTWDVVIDYAYYYNFIKEAESFMRETREIADQNAEDISTNKKSIDNIWKDNASIWGYLHDLQEKDEDLDNDITKLEERHGTDVENIRASIQELDANLRQALANDQRFEQLFSTISQMQQTIEEQQQEISKQNTLLSLTDTTGVMQDGMWCDTPVWDNDDVWQNYPNNEDTVEELSQRVSELESQVGKWNNGETTESGDA